MRCDELADGLTDFLEGDLEPHVQEAALEHLSSCPSCERVLAETRAVTVLAHEHGGATVEPTDRSRLFDRIASDLRAEKSD